MKKYLLPIFAAMLAIVSCSKENGSGESGKPQAPKEFSVLLPDDLEDIELNYEQQDKTLKFEWDAVESQKYEVVFSLAQDLSSPVSVELKNTGKDALTHKQLDGVLEELGVKAYHAAEVFWAISASSEKGKTMSGVRSMQLLRFMAPFTDPRDGEVYRVVRVVDPLTGDAAVWLADNLRARKYTDGTAVDAANIRFSEPEDGADAYHKEWCRLRGAYYSWNAAVRNTQAAAAGEKVQGIAPAGWHIATREEWVFLINNQPDNNNPAASMRSKQYWDAAMAPECNNSFGFNVVSTGYIWTITAGHDIIEGEKWASFWTSTEPKEGDEIPWNPSPADFPNQACVYSFSPSDNGIAYYVYAKDRGYNVRCVLDD